MAGGAETSPSRRPGWLTDRSLLIAIVAVGAVIRLAVLVSKWRDPLRLNDSLYYSIQAVQNADGNWFAEPLSTAPGAEHPPLTVLAITPASFLPSPVSWQRATTTLFGIAAVVLIAMVGRRIGGRRVSLVAAAIAAVYPNLWLSDGLVMAESVAIALVAVVLLAALHHRERSTPASAALCGAAVGLAALARSELLLLVPLLAVVGLGTHERRRWAGRAAALVGASALVVMPWVAWTSARFDAPVLMSTNAGMTLLGANCPPTYYGDSVGGWELGCVLASDERHGGGDQDAIERSNRGRSEAVTYAREHLGRVPVVVAARVLRAADFYGLSSSVRGDVGEERIEWAVWTGIAAWWALAPMAAVGLSRLPRGSRWVLATPAICVAVVTVTFYGSHRLRAPLEPVVAVAAATFLVGAYESTWRTNGAGRSGVGGVVTGQPR